jgi:hypothetical protein
MASAARQTDSSTQAGEAREACDAQASAPGAQEEIRGEDMVGKAFSIPRPPTAGHAWKIKALQYRENSGRTPNTPNPRLPIDMDSFSGLESFVRAADLLSFAEAGRALGISASAAGKL